MTTPHERLKAARAAAGYAGATEAARAMGRSAPTYLAHENGSRGFPHAAADYARFFAVDLDWLMTGRGDMRARVRAFAPLPPIPIMLIRLTHADASARTMGIPEQSRSAPLEG